MGRTHIVWPLFGLKPWMARLLCYSSTARLAPWGFWTLKAYMSWTWTSLYLSIAACVYYLLHNFYLFSLIVATVWGQFYVLISEYICCRFLKAWFSMGVGFSLAVLFAVTMVCPPARVYHFNFVNPYLVLFIRFQLLSNYSFENSKERICFTQFV